MVLLMALSVSSFAQVNNVTVDTVLIPRDTLRFDTTGLRLIKVSKNAIESKVIYSASGYIRNDMKNRKVTLIKSAVVTYGTMEIKADSIVFDMNTSLLFAAGIEDTSGVVQGKPDFKDGSQQFTADELTYNFKTHKALIKNIVTKQESGLLHSQFTKLLEDGTSNISRSTYSTCDLDTPHFYINLPRARVYPGKKIVSGPGNLVLEGIPLPLVIPFGYFPIETKKAASGLIFPRIGQENNRGYSLTEGGYYFAISDYFDLALKTNIYSNGTWMLTTQSSYKKLYKYSGNLNFSYANNISGHLGLPDYRKVINYRLGWTYNQDPKASPGSRFSASVNMSSNGFDRSNSYVVSDHVTTQRQSSISYSKSWDGTPFNFAVSANHSQNVKTGDVSLDLPKIDFNMSRIYPFKSKYSTGKTKWYQELQLSYTAKADNKINTKDDMLFSSDIFRKMDNGFRQEIPMSIQLRPFNNFSVSPSLTYTGVLYTRKLEKLWNTDKQAIEIDTTSGIFYGQAFNPSISAGFNPQIFGMYTFTRPNSRVQAIRHVIKPSVGFSFVPVLAGLSSKMYRQVQTDSAGLNMQRYSIFEGGIFGTPSLASKSGNVSFSLVNILEAKVFDKNDTTGKPKKVKLIDNFGISTSYNIFADSLRWAPVSMQLRTSLFNRINISATSSFTMYSMNSEGRTIGKFYLSDKGKLLRLTNFQTSLDFSLSELLMGKDSGKKTSGSSSSRNSMAGNNTPEGSDDLSQDDSGSALYDEYGYPVFDVPWSMNVSYNLNYSKPGLKSSVSQTLSVRGNVSLTKKMSITYTSGYDFTGKKITMTQIGITRDLHCWQMNFNWVPNGTMKMWNFTIRVKASVLGDLKYERRKDFHDTY
jgi:hypothetical protein